MTKVIVAGAAGRMGCRLIALANASKELQLVGALEAKGHPALGQDAGALAGCGTLGIPLTEDLSSLIGQGDVVIEFSNPSATLEHLACIAQARKAMVIGTTGFSREATLNTVSTKQVEATVIVKWREGTREVSSNHTTVFGRY